MIKHYLSLVKLKASENPEAFCKALLASNTAHIPEFEPAHVLIKYHLDKGVAIPEDVFDMIFNIESRPNNLESIMRLMKGILTTIPDSLDVTKLKAGDKINLDGEPVELKSVDKVPYKQKYVLNLIDREGITFEITVNRQGKSLGEVPHSLIFLIPMGN